MAARRPPRQTKDPVTHRFQSTLTRELCDLLCDTHEQGKDFRNVTAVRCGVHPVTLTRWLKLGANDENAGLHTELFMRMAKVEGDFRAQLLNEVADPTSDVIVITYDDEGKVSGKTTTSRRTSGIQWLMERRFRQYRVEHVQKPDEAEVLSMLEPTATVYSLEMVLDICQQMAAQPERLPVAIRELFATTDWAVPPGSPRKMTNGQEPQH